MHHCVLSLKVTAAQVLEDQRFAQLFSDPNFQINTESEEFRLLNPVVQKVNEKKLKKKTVAEVNKWKTILILFHYEED